MSWGANGGWQQSGDGMLASAIPEVAASIAPLETEWDAAKLEKKMREYFNKAAKNLQFRGRKVADLVNEYADNVMGSIWAGLGDREWLYTGQADFLLCVDAGIKDHFPPLILRNVQQIDFEQMVLAAYDRAFDEQRFCPILSEAVPAVVSGPKTKKKVWNACDAGRKEVIAAGIDNADEFALQWISNTVAQLSQSSQGSPDATMTSDVCCKLFHTLLEGGALPMALTQDGGSVVHLVDEAVTNAYAEHTVPEDAWESAPAAKKRKGAGGPYSAWG